MGFVMNGGGNMTAVRQILPANSAALVLAKILDCRRTPPGLCLPEPYKTLAEAMLACPPDRMQRSRALKAALDGMNGDSAQIRAEILGANPESVLDPVDLLPKKDIPFEQIKQAFDEQESGDARLLASLAENRAVFDHAHGAWYLWTGHHWQADQNGFMYRVVSNELAPLYLRAAATAQESDNSELSKALTKRAAALRTKKRMDAVIFLAARTDSLALTGNEWDGNPLLLGVKNGVIDLQTGEFRAGKPEDYILSYAPTDWRGIDEPAPRWTAFLDDIFSGDNALCDFVQRLFGYGISGKKTERILPILWGEGANGKSTMLEVISCVLGTSLSMSTQADALMDSPKGGDGPRPFVYALRGKRMVWASESNEGRRINAGLVKQLTGNDRITVRTLHTRPVEFSPTHLIMLLTNHKPHISADDLAIWDRVILLPFTSRFVDNPGAGEKQRDRDIQDKLKAESSGILAWLVRGHLAWQTQGLNPPESVKQATRDYQQSEDTLGQFISDSCIVADGAKVAACALYEQYKRWCADNNIPAMTGTAFGNHLTRRFPNKKRVGNCQTYFGIGLASNG